MTAELQVSNVFDSFSEDDAWWIPGIRRLHVGATGKVAGHYTLAAGGVPLTDLPESLTKRLPRYPSVPVARVGRLAVDKTFHGNKLGGALLADAAIRTIRAMRSDVAVFALVVDTRLNPAHR